MRSIGLLVLAGHFLVSSASAMQDPQAQDTTFKNVEYVSGIATLSEKQKGTLVVATSEIRLVGKKGQPPIFAIPIADIRAVNDSLFNQKSGDGKKKSASVSGIPSMPKLPGFLRKAAPEGQITIATQKDSVKEAIVIMTTQSGGIQAIAHAIRGRLQSSATATQSADAGQDAAAAGAQAAPAGPALRMLVANPSAPPADSAAAVEVGDVVRKELHKFVGDKLEVVTREQMNAALDQFGYPPDAVLSRDLAITLAKTLEVPVIVTGDMTKGTDGRYTINAKLGGVNDTTGNPVAIEQQAGESLNDFGRRIAEALKGK